MSFENPTRLRIGMHAEFAGKDYRVLGRVVMGESEDDETYYWQEFNLKAGDGSYADLVYEVSERGAQWRLFTLFEPEYPLTTTDAATKHVGDPLNLTGEDVHVTFRGRSQVYRVEGVAPEGIEVGDVAEYFNAEAGDLMQVVSWTGDEVEYYNGTNLAGEFVNSAFKLPPEPGGFSGITRNFSSLSGSDSGNYGSGAKFALKAVVGIVLLFFIIFGRGLSCSTDYEAAAGRHFAAGPAPLAVDTTGTWHGENYRISIHATMEIARIGLIFDRHEYELTDDNGAKSLVVCGDKPDASDWIFYEQFSPALPPIRTARQLAAKRVGEMVELDGFSGRVSEIIHCTVKQVDGDALSSLKSGGVYYGLVATNEFNMLLARWNTDGIFYYRGQSMAAKNLVASFSAAK
jgi:hypothetical protein